MMADDIDWTTTVGQAYVNQPEDVSKAIQRLRRDAADAGNLATTPQQKVTEKDDLIRIEPAQPKVIYVPQYNPETVYVEESEKDDGVSTGTAIAVGAIAFGAGLAVGSWLNRDYDYYGYYGPPGIYYHGWSGPGWIGVNRSYVDVDVNRNIYVNNNYRNINVNRNIVERKVVPYRGNLTRNASIRSQRVTNARVNRQLNRQPPNGDRLDLNRVPARAPLERNRVRNIGSGPSRTRGVDPSDRSRVDGLRDVPRPNAEARQRPGQVERQRPNSAPRQTQRQPQRQAPSRGGTGGRRRG
jgi:hypothetical protein